jgi:GrxC family glutaredoxin
MQSFGDFLIHNWPLVLALVVILVLLARTWIGPGRTKGVRPPEAIQLINHQDALVVDVRTDKEFQEGHILNALHIPLGVFRNRLVELAAHKERCIVVACRSGARSGQAAAILNREGFTAVHNLSGGLMAWQSANLPVTTAPTKARDLAPKVRPEVVVYVSSEAPLCEGAVALFQAKGVTYREISLDDDPAAREEMVARAQREDAPQIFIGDTHIGGCEELDELDAQGRLDALLGLEPAP